VDDEVLSCVKQFALAVVNTNQSGVGIIALLIACLSPSSGDIRIIIIDNDDILYM
jgi:hypothetical protein